MTKTKTQRWYKIVSTPDQNDYGEVFTKYFLRSQDAHQYLRQCHITGTVLLVDAQMNNAEFTGYDRIVGSA